MTKYLNSNNPIFNVMSTISDIIDYHNRMSVCIQKLQKLLNDNLQSQVPIINDADCLNNNESFIKFASVIISQLKSIGKERTAEAYATAISSLRRFAGNNDIYMSQLSSDFITAYEFYLKECGVSQNTSSFYMRNLRAIYNRAVNKNLISQAFPFKNVYTGIYKTTKRAIDLNTIRKIIKYDASNEPNIEFARDMFLFSFYTRGMSFIDMAYLKHSDLKNNKITYRRRKTGQQLTIKWEICMKKIVDKYDQNNSEFLLPILHHNSPKTLRRQYLNMSQLVNRYLRILGTKLQLSAPLTMYVARHAWASIARSKNVPLSVISDSMGHDSETTTRIYLASLDNFAIDKANSLILKSLL